MTTSATSVAFEKKVHPMTTVPDAIRMVLQQTARVVLLEQEMATEDLDVTSPFLLGRRLSETIVMPEPGYPAYPASVMDGYAIRSQDNSTDKNVFRIVNKVFAGDDQPTRHIEQQEATTTTTTSPEGSSSHNDIPNAYYITTGAVIPDGCDTVIPVEECHVQDDTLTVLNNASVQSGKWIRRVGFDIPAGTVVLSRGHIIQPSSYGLLLQAGITSVKVQRELRAGVLSTGNELLQPGESTRPGKIPDVNRPILIALLTKFGTCKPVDLGIQRDDDMTALTSTIQNALMDCDVILTTGGISMGESDILEQVLVEQLGGTLHFGRMHMKPGKPTTFCTMAHAPTKSTRFVFAMPGNPVSATVCTELLVRPCLQLWHDGPDTSADTHGESIDDMIYRIVQNAWTHPEVTATLAHNVTLDKERPEYHRVVLTKNADGKIMATSTGVQQSSRLMSLRDAEGLLILPQGVGTRTMAKEGEEFTLLLLDGGRTGSRVGQSQHLNRKSNKSFTIGVVHVLPSDADEKLRDSIEEVALEVQIALSGTKSGPADVASSQSFSGDPNDLFDFATATCDQVDVIVVVCQSSFRHHLDVAASLRQRLVKVADALALQARRGVAAEVPASALLETVVGYTGSSMLILLPHRGLKGGLENVRGLLKHALQVARDKNHR